MVESSGTIVAGMVATILVKFLNRLNIKCENLQWIKVFWFKKDQLIY